MQNGEVKRSRGQFGFLSSRNHPESTEDTKPGLVKSRCQSSMNIFLQLIEGAENWFNNNFRSCITLQAEVAPRDGCCTPGCVWGRWGHPMGHPRVWAAPAAAACTFPSLCRLFAAPTLASAPSGRGREASRVDELVTRSSWCLGCSVQSVPCTRIVTFGSLGLHQVISSRREMGICAQNSAAVGSQ